MSESKHTPEPWWEFPLKIKRGSFGDQGPLTIASGNLPVAEVPREGGYDLWAQQSADRIVSCANALAGVSDPAAFMAAVRELREAAAETMPDLERFNTAARLSSTLDGSILSRSWPAFFSMRQGPGPDRRMERLRAALARLEGGGLT